MTKEEYDKIEYGQHLWGLLDEELAIVAKDNIGFTICGAWECIIPFENITLIELINKPENYKNTEYYYFYK